MIFEKQGKICDASTLGLTWLRKNIMTPVPYVREDGTLRVFVAFCDADNVGRVGYLDIDDRNPAVIKRISKTPVLDVGQKGTFDEHGVLPASVIKKDGKLYMFYTAYQRQISVPYTIFSGLAVSHDDGDSYVRVFESPILDRRPGQLFQRSAMEVVDCGGVFRTWYTAGSGWQDINGHIAPRYNLQCIDTSDFRYWHNEPKVSIELKDDEYGLTMPQVFIENGRYKMFYSIRSISRGYHMGYAESSDGIAFERMDDRLEFTPSPDEFDREMMCFGKVQQLADGRNVMFYCGNHYGIGGLGWAQQQ